MEKIKNIKEISCCIEAENEVSGIRIKDAQNSKYGLIIYALQFINELHENGFDDDEIRQIADLIKCFVELD